MTDADSWSTQQLTVLLTLISSTPDRVSAMETALEFAVASVDAEIGAIVSNTGELLASIGFRGGEEPIEQFIDVMNGARKDIKTSDFCASPVLVLPMGLPDENGTVVIGRCSDIAFTTDEKTMLRGMVRVLALTLRSLSTLHRERSLRRSLQERQRFLESLAGIQRLITSRAPLEQLLDEIVERTQDHLSGFVTSLLMLEPGESRLAKVAAVSGDNAQGWRAWSGPLGPTSMRAIEQGVPVIDNVLEARGGRIGFTGYSSIAKLAAVPVLENGDVVGVLAVARRSGSPDFTPDDAETLNAFGEHASIVITDASTVNEVHRAMQDPLTGLPNRSLFLQHVEGALDDAPAQTVAVLFIDLDGFKRVNDTLGHAAGDVVLAAAASRLRECVRDEDILGRIGGDEFSLLARSFKSRQMVESAAHRIVDALKEPFRIHGRDVFIGASVGIALNSVSDDAEDLLRRADVAMYRAKASRAGSLVFHPEMQEQLMHSLEIEADLRASIDEGHFELFYQPVVQLHGERLVGFEALVRWNHPTLGRLTPDSFIPQAEETGLITAIDNWVVRSACRQIDEWRSEFGISPSVGVNVSGLGIVHNTFMDSLQSAIHEYDIDPQLLIIELTETVLIEDLDAVAHRLEEIRLTGVRLAIDDFGTGYSSLTHLHRFPFNVIKIDRSFVAGLGGADPLKAGLVRAVLRLGSELGMEIIAEGVETTTQCRELRDAGCELAQGYLFDKPLQVDSATSTIRASQATAERL